MDKDRKELLERVRTFYRTTGSGRKVRWDEPGENDDNPDVKSHNAYVAKVMQQKKQKAQSAERLKAQNKVPTKKGKPMWEEMQNENYSQFITSFRRAYQSNRVMTFRKWLETIEELIDTLV